MSTMWNSTESLSRLNDILQFALIALGVVIALLSILTFLVGRRIAVLEDAEAVALRARVAGAEETAAALRLSQTFVAGHFVEPRAKSASRPVPHEQEAALIALPGHTPPDSRT